MISGNHGEIITETESVCEPQSTETQVLSNHGEIGRANVSHIDIDRGTVVLSAGDSGEYAGIRVNGSGTLILDGCNIDLVGEEEGGNGNGEVNVSELGSLSLLNGSELTVSTGIFSVKGWSFKAERSRLFVTNINGGKEGDPDSYGDGLDGESGNCSVIEIDTSIPVIIDGSDVICQGGHGGNGAHAMDEVRKNGGDGGEGGSALFRIEAPCVDMTGNSTLLCLGGRGGSGGERVPTLTTAKGGDGGMGGKATFIIHTNDTVSIVSSKLNVSGGCGGDASRTSGDELYGMGGRGGDTEMLISCSGLDFEDCNILGLGGNGGLGGNRNVDGMPGRDELIMKAEGKMISGEDSVITITNDCFGIDNPMGENELDNVTLVSREGEAIMPCAVGGTKITIRWNIEITVIDDHTKKGMPDAEILVKIRDQDNELVTIRDGTTDLNGRVSFKSILARTIDGDNPGKLEWVWIWASKYTYHGYANWPLDHNLIETIPIKILTLRITEISYRSALVGDSMLKKVSVSEVRDGRPLGGVIYVNGTAYLESSSPDGSITEVAVEVNGGSKVQVEDTSESSDWTRWLYRLDASKKLSGTGAKTRMKHIYDEETVELSFSAFESNGHTATVSIPIKMNQSGINNPPHCAITGIAEIDYTEQDEPERKIIYVPPEKQTDVRIEGEYFDVDGDTFDDIEVYVQNEAINSTRLISRSDNTEVNNSAKTWTVNWNLDTRIFVAGDYLVYANIYDGEMNTSDSDHFEIRRIPITIFQESRPKFNWIRISGGGKTYNHNETVVFDDGTKMTITAECDTDAHARLTRYRMIITDKQTFEVIAEKEMEAAGNLKFSHKFTLPSDEGREYKVELFAFDDRGYKSEKEFIIPTIPTNHDYYPPEQPSYLFPTVIAIISILIVGTIIFLSFRERKRKVSDEQIDQIWKEDRIDKFSFEKGKK